MLLGRNGAGKSTTLKASWGWCGRARGEIVFDGRRIDRLERLRDRAAGLGYVPEDRRIFTDLTVTENLEVGRQPPRARRAGLDAGAALRALSRTSRRCATGPAAACPAASSRC